MALDLVRRGAGSGLLSVAPLQRSSALLLGLPRRRLKPTLPLALLLQAPYALPPPALLAPSPSALPPLSLLTPAGPTTLS